MSQLLEVLNAKGGWGDANVRFVEGNFGADIQVTLFNQDTIHSQALRGCASPQLACAGSDNDIPAHCIVNLDYMVATSGTPGYTMAGAGIIYHEIGHCFFGTGHRPSDRLMKPKLDSVEQQDARPSPEMLAELRKRPDTQLIASDQPTAE